MMVAAATRVSEERAIRRAPGDKGFNFSLAWALRERRRIIEMF